MPFSLSIRCELLFILCPKKIFKKENNKDKNVHRFALSAIRGELLEREREIEKEKEIVL